MEKKSSSAAVFVLAALFLAAVCSAREAPQEKVLQPETFPGFPGGAAAGAAGGFPGFPGLPGAAGAGTLMGPLVPGFGNLGGFGGMPGGGGIAGAGGLPGIFGGGGAAGGGNPLKERGGSPFFVLGFSSFG